jgi:benzoyl-CoA reductase/2-hydroxyglutaryl-CoA dehydratase subunit BcrC/BadD/HgdB
MELNKQTRGTGRVSERTMAWLIRRPLMYDLVRGPLSFYASRDDNPAFRIWVSFLLRTHRQGFSRCKPVIWSSAFVPTELVYGLGGIPIHPEILASLMAYFSLSGWFLEKADTELSTDLCSFYRIALGMALADYLPRPDLLLSCSMLCDGSNKFFGYLGELYGVPHFFIDVPYRHGTLGRCYLIDQFRGLVDSISHLTGIPWQPERMDRIVRHSNQAREYLLRINDLRRAKPAPFPGSEALSYGAGMIFSSMGSAQGVAFFQTLLGFVRQKVEQGEGYLPQEDHRLLWLHHIRPYYPNRIFDVLDEKRAAVAFEEVSHVSWPYLEKDRIFESLAQKMLSNASNGPVERRLEAALKMAKTYAVNGVIHFSHWGCRQSCGGANVIANSLKDQGFPCMVLDGDGGDPSNYSPGQTRTRLEAFVEMLGAK